MDDRMSVLLGIYDQLDPNGSAHVPSSLQVQVVVLLVFNCECILVGSRKPSFELEAEALAADGGVMYWLGGLE